MKKEWWMLILVLIAAGVYGQPEVYNQMHLGVSVDARTNVATKEETYETSSAGVFAAEMCRVSRWSYGRSGKENRLPRSRLFFDGGIQICKREI